MMNNICKRFALLFGVVMLWCTPGLVAQNKFEVHGKMDITSDYIWRGADQNSGASIQPSLTLEYAGLSLNVWGSQSLTKWGDGGAKEWDINLGYTYKNFTIMVSDYWWSGVNQPYGHYKNNHYFEGTISYCFGERVPLTLSWSTMFAGGDKNAKGKLQGSTYISASYNIKLPADIYLCPAIGFTPWKGMYHNKAAFTDISLKASKTLELPKGFSLPLSVQGIVSPTYDRTYLVASVGLGF